MLRRRRRDANGPGRYRLFYASDLHGSDLAWRKFLSAGRVFKAGVLIMGGDLTGKAIIPIVTAGARITARFQGRDHVFASEQQIESFEENVRTNGFYPYRCDAEEYARMSADPDLVSDVFRRVMIETLERWMALADTRLASGEVELFVMPGNDDELYLDPYIAGSHVENCDGRSVKMGDYKMYSLAWATTTPWDTARDDRGRAVGADHEPGGRRVGLHACDLQLPRAALRLGTRPGTGADARPRGRPGGWAAQASPDRQPQCPAGDRGVPAAVGASRARA
jgi:Icc-related predicted phosphoesterase